MKAVTMSISNQWFQTCLPGLFHKARKVTAPVEIIGFICLAKRFLSLTDCCEKRPVTVPGAKGSELTILSWKTQLSTTASWQNSLKRLKGGRSKQQSYGTPSDMTVQSKRMMQIMVQQHGQCSKTCQNFCGGTAIKRQHDKCVPLFHCVSQHHPLAWKAPNVTPGNVYFIRSEEKGRSSFLKSLAQSSHKSSIRPNKSLTFLSFLVPDGWML